MGGSFEHGTVYVSADFCGTAIWFPPGVHPNDEALERAFRDTAQPDHVDDLLGTFEKMAQWHPEEPHWYLPMIGVEPSAQGKGLGTELMRHAVVRCDEQRALAYLESANPRNISLYLRHGFEVMNEFRVSAGTARHTDAPAPALMAWSVVNAGPPNEACSRQRLMQT